MLPATVTLATDLDLATLNHRLAAQNPVWILTARKEEECPATEN